MKHPQHILLLTSTIALTSLACGSQVSPPKNIPVVMCTSEPGSNEPDKDGDGVVDRCDNCVDVENPDQLDPDHDGKGNLCDTDDDNDGILDEKDNCPNVAHKEQTDSDDDGKGDACDPCPRGQDTTDSDKDGVNDCVDLCIDVKDADNKDSDRDGIGDACDNCPQVPNAGQYDRDNDGKGDECDSDHPFSIVEANIEDIHKAIKDKKITCSDVLEQHFERIQRLDLDVSDGPPINAFVTINPRARELARELDTHFKDTGKLKGPLHCAPIVIKDIYNSKEMPVSSGSLALVGMRPNADAYTVEKMRAAGALIMATTTMDEFSKGIHGISSRSGRTGNAFNSSRNPGGSSSGSGAAVGASFAVGGTGTDNCASLSIPGAYNGLITLRSSTGLVSLKGIYPSNRFDAVAGPLTRSVKDMTLMLDAMAGENPDDPLTKLPKSVPRPDSYTTYLDKNALKGKRIGILRTIGKNTQENPSFMFTQANSEVLTVYRKAFEDMERMGATVIDNIRLPDLDTRRSSAGVVDDVNAYLEKVTGPHRNYLSVCKDPKSAAFAKSSDASCTSYDTWSRTLGTADSDHAKTLQGRYTGNKNYIADVMNALSLDALLLPVDALGGANTTWSISNCVITSVSGTPSMNILVGYTKESIQMPIGMMFIGRQYDDHKLLSMAYAYEQGTKHRKPPQYSTSVPPDKAVPQLDIEKFNALRLAIGQAAFDKILKTGKKFDLSGSKFTEITKEVLRDKGFSWILGE